MYLSEIGELFGDLFSRFIERALELALGILKSLSDLDMLWAMALALAAADALRGGRGVF